MLSTVAVQNMDILRALATGQFTGKSQLANHLGGNRADLSNLNRALGRMEEEELITWPTVTERGKACIRADDVAAGRVAMPDGMLVLRHRQIIRCDLNPRTDWTSPEAIGDLISLRESILLRGVRHNLQVRPTADPETFQIIDGERRWRAVGEAIHEGDLPENFPLICLVKEVSDQELMFDAVDANIQTRALTEIEEGRQFARLRDTFGVTTAEIAERINKSQKYVQNRIRLTTLDPELQARMELPKDDQRHLGYKKALSDHLIEKRAPAAAKESTQPKLDIPPAFGLALMELAHLAQRFPAKLVEPGFVEVVTIKSGRYLAWLNDRKIITVRRESDRTFVKILAYSSGALAWLEERGFNADPVTALREARLAVGPEHAVKYLTLGHYLTVEIDECRLLNFRLPDEQSADQGEARPEAAPSAVTPAKAQPRTSQRDRDQAAREAAAETRLQVLMRGLPDERRDIINCAGDFITAFDASIRDRNDDQASTAAEAYTACVAKLNGGTLFASEADEDKPGRMLRRFYKAQTGDEPRWGESGEFLLRVDGMVAHVVVKGNLANSTGIEFWAVELDQPFISNTAFSAGFLGFGDGSMPSLDGAGVAVEVARLMRVRMGETKRKIKVDAEHLERRIATLAASPWIAEAMAAGVVLDGTAMIEAHEAEDQDEDSGWVEAPEADQAIPVRKDDHARDAVNVADLIDRRQDILISAYVARSSEITLATALTTTDGRMLGGCLFESGRFSKITMHHRSGSFLQGWGDQ